MKKLYYFIIPALLLGSCQSDPTLETESSPLVRTKVTELQYAQTDKIDVEALNIISPYKFVKKGNLYAFLTPSSAYRFAIYDSENGTVTRLSTFFMRLASSRVALTASRVTGSSDRVYRFPPK